MSFPFVKGRALGVFLMWLSTAKKKTFKKIMQEKSNVSNRIKMSYVCEGSD